ncbi:Fe2+-dependent dioxygenase [Erythrobacter sp.]|uniref:Fe2+-dependent dioxygenase n=1 Tax=Erythrobacter sp. TaxID=1042 RepID=UPI001425D6D6|nr:Fe2+-dependent dioxygenase [Erythrobacter sp.]QIQ86959.1 MAG: Fe2+-dependent dioxygenase [Erythrobacter sp.]
MILTVRAVEDPAPLAARIERLEWRDGRATAGATAKAVKRNLQAVLKGREGEALHGDLLGLVADNPVVKAAAQPRRFSRLLLSRTEDGGHYGAHVDNALMGTGEERMRTDISFTLFLSPPEDYEGGELVVYAAGMTQWIKPQAGELVLYPSSSIHEVRPVTKGARVACVGWIESWIADPSQREMLFDLENLRVSLRASLPRQSAELLTLDKTIANLLRMWGRR